MQIPVDIRKREPVLRRIAVAVGIIVLLACAARAIIKPDDGDFNRHWETGRRFLAGEFLYTGGHDFPYPPFFGMIFAATAFFPMPVAKAVFYPAGIAALLVLLWIMRRLVQSIFRLNDVQAFWTTALAAFLAIQFLIRDQAELGLNTIITAMTWSAIYLWRQRRDLLAGLSLGAAIAIKCTPVIFFAYFAWKRQWRLTICTAAAALFFTALPMLWQGPTSWTGHMRTWVGNVIDGVSGRGFQTLDHFRARNISLRPSLMAYLTHSPAAQNDEVPPVDFLNLSPTAANWIAIAISLALVGFFIWSFRGTVATRDDPQLLWQLAAVGILGLLLSPITWTEHCVALVPACYLIAALVVTKDRLRGWIVVLVLIFILFCSLLGRDLIGRNLWLGIAGFRVTTFCIVGFFVILLAGPREAVGPTGKESQS